MMQPQKICPQCQHLNAIAVPQCPQCGHAFRTQFVTPPSAFPPQQTVYVPPTLIQDPDFIQVTPGSHEATAAILLSLLLPGGGQCYNKQVMKGLLVFVLIPGLIVVGWILFFFGVLSANPGLVVFLPVFWFLIPILWFGQVIDAAIIASRLNRGELVGKMKFF